MRLLAFICLFLPLVAQADLYRCQDRTGHVTYTNLDCAKLGLKEDKAIPTPPPPDEGSGNISLEASSRPMEKPTGAAFPLPRQTSDPLASLALSDKPAKGASADCRRVKGLIGAIMDEMDASRALGYTPQQERDWDSRLNALQAEKLRLSCF